MKTLLFFFATLCFGQSNVSADTLFGVGATYPNQVYQAWGKAYEVQTGRKLSYLPVGSGKGINAIIGNKTDFGATDKPLKLEELNRHNLLQFPMLVGGVVAVLNVKGIANNSLVLDGDSLAQIYLGKITRWNDPVLRVLNPTLSLPDDEIVVVTRSDKSGTTFNFTNYLSKVSRVWQTSVGEGLSVTWPVGIPAEGTKGVASSVAAIPNAIGYMDLADAQKKQLNYSQLKNKSKAVITANAASFAAAAAEVKWTLANGYFEILTDTSSAIGWPITAATFILLPRTSGDAERVTAAIQFFDWAYRDGDALATKLNFVAIPDEVADIVRTAWQSQIKNRTGQSVW